MTVSYDIEEKVEDAFVQYLSNTVGESADISIVPAFSTDVIMYPCAVIRAARSEKIDAKGAWNSSRHLAVEIAVLTEAANTVDGLGKVVTTARQRNSDARAAVMNALSISDTATGPAGLADLCDADDLPQGLAAHLSWQQIPGVWIKYAQVGPIERTVEPDKKCLVSVISVAVIAQAVQVGGY